MSKSTKLMRLQTRETIKSLINTKLQLALKIALKRPICTYSHTNLSRETKPCLLSRFATCSDPSLAQVYSPLQNGRIFSNQTDTWLTKLGTFLTESNWKVSLETHSIDLHYSANVISFKRPLKTKRF